mgnify:FL=1
MLLSMSGVIEIPEYWLHDPNITNFNGETVAIIIAKLGRVPWRIWWHDPTLKDNVGHTVATHLLLHKVPNIPKDWLYYSKTSDDNKYGELTGPLEDLY